MSEMVEKIAEIIRGSIYEHDGVADHMHEGAALRAARAILKALREPTEAQMEAGLHILDNQEMSHSRPLPTLSNAWRAMIDEALK